MRPRSSSGRRLLADWPAGRWTIRSPRDVADRLVLQMGRLEREELRVVMLNTKNVVLRVADVYQGNVASSLVRVGELYRDAVRLNAAGIILVHNHPSGDPTPSPDDLHLTAEALAAGRLLDIQLLDHLVIGHDVWVSLRDRGISFDRTELREPPTKGDRHAPSARHVDGMRAPLAFVVALSAVAAACSPAPPPTSSPEEPRPSRLRHAVPTGRFDGAAPLGPEFDEDIFVRDESTALATEFLVGTRGDLRPS